jgi:CheY-like chemotaxis protein
MYYCFCAREGCRRKTDIRYDLHADGCRESAPISAGMFLIISERPDTCNGNRVMAQILVIDDDHEHCKVFVEAVQAAGHVATGVENGKVALDFMEKHDFDLVITDILMPEKEGLETIMYLRREKPDLPVIAVSGGARIGPEAYLDIAARMGVRYTFQKPVDLNDLCAAVHECLTEV